MSKSGPFGYFREVKQEAQKVTWPSRKETIASTIAVFIMVIMASLFLYLSDQVLAYLVSLILGIGSKF
ncbi:MAG: preprotein translocase subunit SecE [Micavibrio aeruginosavorus]|uniref:Protein translocase subunit SecE n=1 Tax=Micavibrio aeruginosavorus TaxID=349221 RepID=A0A2W5MRC4_9BACT|nr:MAG: preprotein translocase subunit SecE [Micavibrio aeruginosavorus]